MSGLVKRKATARNGKRISDTEAVFALRVSTAVPQLGTCRISRESGSVGSGRSLAADDALPLPGGATSFILSQAGKSRALLCGMG